MLGPVTQTDYVRRPCSVHLKTISEEEIKLPSRLCVINTYNIKLKMRVPNAYMAFGLAVVWYSAVCLSVCMPVQPSVNSLFSMQFLYLTSGI